METDPSIVFGNLLKLVRENAGLTQKELAEKVFCSPSLVSAIETGSKPAKQDLIVRMDEETKAKGALLAVWPVTANEGYSAAFVASLEKDATKIHEWEPRIVPGLLQTSDYARSFIRTGRPRAADEQVEEDVTARIKRQGIFTEAAPPMAWFVIDESVLYRPFGGKEVMREQLMKLEELGKQPSIIIQVMPFSATGQPGAEGPLRVVEYAESPPVRYTEGWYSGRMTQKKDDVSEAMTYFDLIRASAMSPEDSSKFIATARGSHYE